MPQGNGNIPIENTPTQYEHCVKVKDLPELITNLFNRERMSTRPKGRRKTRSRVCQSSRANEQASDRIFNQRCDVGAGCLAAHQTKNMRRASVDPLSRTGE